MKLSQFKFKLDPERIAQHPAPFRDECRLMVLHTKSGVIEHRDHFYDILDYFDDKDVFVFNDTKGPSRHGFSPMEVGFLLMKEPK